MFAVSPTNEASKQIANPHVGVVTQQFNITPMPLFVPSSSASNFMFSAPPTTAFLPIATSTHFVLAHNDFLNAAIANMNAQKTSQQTQFTQSTMPNEMIQFTKTVTPPISSMASSPVQAVETQFPQTQLSLKEIEKLLVLRYQMQQQEQRIQ